MPVNTEEVERYTRQVLAALKPTQTLTTAELVNRLSAVMPDDTREADLYPALKRITSRTLCHTVPKLMDTGPHKGKTINARRWHHLATADMPQRPATPSAGAASPGTSLLDRVQRLEEWAARTDPLFPVL